LKSPGALGDRLVQIWGGLEAEQLDFCIAPDQKLRLFCRNIAHPRELVFDGLFELRSSVKLLKLHDEGANVVWGVSIREEKSSVSTRSGGGADSDKAILVVHGHFIKLSLLVGWVILDDTKGVDPEVGNLELSADFDCILHSFG
jgi:hypothetical protein